MSAFLDTNILVYAQQTGVKAEISQDLIAAGGTISVQVLNELANVLRKKLGRSWRDIELVLADVINALDPALPLTVETNRVALALARDHNIAVYDALIVARRAGSWLRYAVHRGHAARPNIRRSHDRQPLP